MEEIKLDEVMYADMAIMALAEKSLQYELQLNVPNNRKI